MPSDRHEASVQRVRQLLRQLGHSIMINDQQAGRDGYKLEPIVCPDGKPRAFIIDCLCRLNTGAMLAFEVDLKHETTSMKLWALRKMFITPVYPINPPDVDLWQQDPSLLEAEIAFRVFGRKKVAVLQ